MNTGAGLQWLRRLRWTAAAGQTATISLTYWGLNVRFPIALMLSVVGLTLLSQGLLCGKTTGRRSQQTRLGSVLALDVLLLTALLFLSGGPHNPFSSFYLIHIAMAAAILPAPWTWGLLGLSTACFGGLFWRHVPLALPMAGDPVCGLIPLQLHLVGMFVALTLTGLCLAAFVARLHAQVQRQQAELHAATLRAERQARYESLATLAAGVAHEMGTPLATIAVAARELERALNGRFQDALDTDARLIRAQVERCRDLLAGLRRQAGDDSDDPPVSLGTTELLAAVREWLPPMSEERLKVDLREAPDRVHAPRTALARALANLIRNALDASPVSVPVDLKIRGTPDAIAFTVLDRGTGLEPGIATRVGEPFLTTKPPGQGTGLGLFLVRRFAEEWGGAFGIESRSGGGTSACLTLPATPSP